MISYVAWYRRQEVLSEAQEFGKDVNAWDITFAIQNDMYLILFFLMPLLLFLSFRTIEQQYEPTILIRVGSFRNWVYYSTKRYVRAVLTLFGFVLLLSLLSAVDQPFTLQWSPYSQLATSDNISHYLVSSFHSPLSVILLQPILWLLTSIVLHGLMCLMFLLHEKRNGLLLQAAGVVIWCIFSFKSSFGVGEFFSPATYFSVGAVSNIMHPWIALVILSLAIVLIYLLAQWMRPLRQLLTSRNEFVPYLTYAMLASLYIFLSSSRASTELQTIGDLFVVVFYGVSAEGSSFLQLVSHLILFFGLAYLSQLRLQDQMTAIGPYTWMRYQRLEKWALHVFVKEGRFYLLALSLLILGTMVIGMLQGVSLSLSTSLLSISPMQLLLQLFGISMLQLMLYSLFSFILLWQFPDGYAMLGLFGVLSVFLLPNFNRYGIFPSGLNGFAQLQSFSLTHLLIVLLIYVGLSLVWLYVLFQKSIRI
ncbi:hypothetical protein [Exiguobacterium sp. OS-77]|uniref:hypothetical protein n=1 Tax=Exiguobacterium sp. OS-77 TaxID=1241306 RepID=UPI0011AE1C36|nr:hypothetical protein [Exiguobacterium sp. OS-77]